MQRANVLDVQMRAEKVIVDTDARVSAERAARAAVMDAPDMMVRMQVQADSKILLLQLYVI